jgi:3-phenylpropionate/trans-cinnamate dioxygenase ferredoxin subunit
VTAEDSSEGRIRRDQHTLWYVVSETQALEEIRMATIKVIQNGPYLVQGDDVTAVDWNGATYAIPKRPFALCRCGGSTTKPFCDGTHSRTGFKAAEAAVPGSEDKSATKP